MKLRRTTLPRGREQELTRWGWGGGLPWVMSWGFPLREGWFHTSCSRLVSPAGTARHTPLLTPDMNYSMSNSLAPPPTRGSAQSHPNTRLIYYFRCHKSSRCNCFALRWVELWRVRGGTTFPSRIQYYYSTIVRLPHPSSRWFRITEYWRRLA